jgi:hypothetical protein
MPGLTARTDPLPDHGEAYKGASFMADWNVLRGFTPKKNPPLAGGAVAAKGI